jgi:hypothetical protein
MDLETTWVSIVMVGVWIVVLSRLPTLFKPLPPQSATARFILRVGWSAMLGLCVVVPLYHPWVRSWLAGTGWFSNVPHAAAAIIVMVMTSRFCFKVAPVIQPRLDWPLWAGMLAIGAYVGSAWTIHFRLQGDLTLARQQIPDQFFNLYMVFICLLVVIPAHKWVLRQELQPAMRLRLQAIIALWSLFATWALVGVAQAAAVLGGIRFDFRPVYAFLGMTQLFAFIVYFLPGRTLLRLREVFDYVCALPTLAIIWMLECHVKRITGRRRRPLVVSDVVQSPREATYPCVIAILDSRKLLLQNANAFSSWLSLNNWIAWPALNWITRKLSLGFARSASLQFGAACFAFDDDVGDHDA